MKITCREHFWVYGICIKNQHLYEVNNSVVQGDYHCYDTYLIHNKIFEYSVVMGGIENFLSRLLKDKIPRYHGILPYSDFYTFTNILLRNLQDLSIFIMQLISDEKYYIYLRK